MRGIEVLAIAALSAALAGCANLSAPVATADRTPAGSVDRTPPRHAEPRRAARIKAARATPVRPTPDRPHEPDLTVNVSSAGELTAAPPPAAASETLRPFSPEWRAREDEIESRLRQKMMICRGC